MATYWIDPLRDPRWPELVEAHPKASIFHHRGWLRSLQRTYGYEPCAVTGSPPGTALADAVLFCRIRNRFARERLVSLPFADHCEPLVDREDQLHCLLDHLCRDHSSVEIRPLSPPSSGLRACHRFRAGKSFRFHLLDLRPSLDELFRSFDRNSIQRGIRRGERHPLVFEEGRSPELLKKFYYLQVLTRRRHGVPPPPVAWFGALLSLLAEKAIIRLVSSDGRPVAACMILFDKNSAVYKYGGSDPRYNSLRGTTLLYWRTIQDARLRRAKTLDLGRSESRTEA